MNAPAAIRWLLLYRLGIFLFAVLAAFVLASVIATQSVISSLGDMGVDVNLQTRFAMTTHDLAGMAGAFLPMIAAGYLAAFLVAGMLCHWWPQWRMAFYIAAGAAALVTIHLALKLAFGITPIAVGRTGAGLFSQGLAGAVGAYVFARLMR